MNINRNIPDTVKYMMSLGLSTTKIEATAKHLQAHYYTPRIIEKYSENSMSLSVFDKMAADRILFVTKEVNDDMATIIQAQLLYLDTISNEDITFYTNSPGGSVLSGLTMYDTMNYVNSDIATVVTGMAASMGSIIASSGTKGKRVILPNARFMLHKVSGGAQGVIDDMEISLAEAKKYNEVLFQILANNTGKDKKQILKDCNRDLWLNAQESVDYGLCDAIIDKKHK